MYAVKHNPVLKLMGAHFYRTEDIQTMYYLTLHHTQVYKLYYKSLVLNCARLMIWQVKEEMDFELAP